MKIFLLCNTGKGGGGGSITGRNSLLLQRFLINCYLCSCLSRPCVFTVVIGTCQRQLCVCVIYLCRTPSRKLRVFIRFAPLYPSSSISSPHWVSWEAASPSPASFSSPSPNPPSRMHSITPVPPCSSPQTPFLH